MKKNVLCIIGTRPEAIKMAPVIQALHACSNIDCKVLITAQHRDLLDQVLTIFKIEADYDFDIMQQNQSLSELTSRLFDKFEDLFQHYKPDVVLAQGDTTTVMVASIASFYQKIPFGHVEAGLRTGDLLNPFPEEMNRIVAGHLAQWHFAPTESSRQNLLREGIPNDKIYLTGNTVIDALYSVENAQFPSEIVLDATKRLILVTAHRRENFGQPFINICEALKMLAQRNKDIQILYPVHPNPNIQSKAHEILSEVSNIILCKPLEYLSFVAAMQKSYFIISDSGGVQEEAPALGKPVLVLRDETERPEAVDAGVVKLVGTEMSSILSNAQLLLDDETVYKSMAKGISPYGDGNAAKRIADLINSYVTACS